MASPTPRTETRSRPRMTGDERREQLLDVTKAIVGEVGFHAVSIEAVARGAGITRPVVYGHFHDLGGLLEAMLARETARANAQLARILPPATWQGSSQEMLLGALRGYLEAVRADSVTWRLVLMPQEGAPEMLHEQIGRGREAVLAVLTELVRPGFAPGRPPPDPMLTARTLSTLADEAARLILTDPDQFPIDRVMDHAAWLVDQLVA
ncbi:MAG TPA: TetR/AcrR family transcriptional regulator [Solirubrobacteraceae bacterium]|jgi:AcrR family transcriptional regulator|nr:TetR/AcrR family transcriptional regulator [Solirubrobacteraceae bacterium]